jgi:hypothetical protein
MENKRKDDPKHVAYSYLATISFYVEKYPKCISFIKEYFDSIGFRFPTNEEKVDFYKEEYIPMYDDLLSQLTKKIETEYQEYETLDDIMGYNDWPNSL